MKTNKANWKNEVVKMVAGRTSIEHALTLETILFALPRNVTLSEFKAGMVELYEAGRIILDDYTRAWADIAGEPAAIEYKINRQSGYGLKWFVRAAG
jgi:hypothetical protein